MEAQGTRQKECEIIRQLKKFIKQMYRRIETNGTYINVWL